MSFPFVSEESFETGTRGDFDAETDDDGKLDFPHYSELWRVPGLAMPYRGAYCMRIDLSGGTSDAYVQETGDWDMTTGSDELYGRFMLWVSDDITMGDTDEFAVLEFWSSTSTAEAGIFINFTDANGLRLGIGKGSAAQLLPLTTGTWHAVEFFFDPAGTSNGTFDAWLDGASFTQVASLTNATITSGVVGALASGTGGYASTITTGTLLFDWIVTDDAQVYPPNERWPNEVMMTESGHVFAGPGRVDNVALIAGAATDNVLEIHDTDVGNTNDASGVKLRLSNTANSETVDTAGTPIRLVRGCYVNLTGTNPRALVQIGRANAYGSEGVVRTYASKRRERPRGV